MNPNVGRIVNGNAVLDRATFARVVEPALRTAAVNSAPLAQWGQTIGANAQMTDNRDFTNLFTSGRAAFLIPGLDFSPFVQTYQDSEGQWNGSVDVGGVAAYMDAKIADPNTVFILDSEEPGGNYHNRRRTLYFRKNDVVLPVSTKTYYEASNWVDGRAGVIFVFGVVFSLVGAPVLSAELSSIAAGETAAVATVSNAQIISTVATNAGNILGDARIGAAGKLVSLASGQLSSTDAITSQAGATAVDDYSDAFNPFDYSSGESLDFFGDAQVNDYGFGETLQTSYPEIDWNSNAGWSADAYGLGDYTSVAEYGATPEVTTNMFGTTFDNAFGDVSIKTAVDGLNLAKTVQSAVTSTGTAGVKSGGKQAAVAGGSNDILSTFSSVINGISGAAKSIGGVASQVTTTQKKTYAGQLTPTGGVASGGIGGVSMNTILLIGAGILAVGFIMKRG